MRFQKPTYLAYFGFGIWLAVITFILSAIPAWFTHVIHCIQNEEWFFLIAGAIMFPIGSIHGWGLWFGWF